MNTRFFAVVYFRIDSVTGKREADWYDEKSARTLNLFDSPQLTDKRVKFAIGLREVDRLRDEYEVWISNETVRNFEPTPEFKDDKYFIRLDIKNVDVAHERKRMEKNGWIVVTKGKNNKFLTTFYVCKWDHRMKERFCEDVGESSDESFVNCLKKAKEYYEKHA